MFQSTHPRGVRLVENISSGIDDSSFNPRTREGCDELAPAFPARSCVSIHAPARGATTPFYLFGFEILVSIHAPARGATPTSSK
ncbi:Octaprenyl diphosphate synthase / Dimethylallyltransferase / (2E,6E)-farnesyl diphosphate synthase / Geranylgeranyl pyrophosphate synthetase, partial [Olavius algarvensis spirochete endosymbiont]